MTEDLVPLDGTVVEYTGRVTPLKSGGRRDVEVTNPLPAQAFQGSIVKHWRSFFSNLDQEVDERQHDPVAMATGLANAEALLADVRFVRDRLRDKAARALRKEKIRRLTVTDTITVEGKGEIKRTDWENERLLVAMLRQAFGDRIICADNGDMLNVETEVAPVLLDWFTPSWKLTPIREAGLDPHDYCTVDKNDDGKAVATPAVSIVDNVVRHNVRRS